MVRLRVVLILVSVALMGFAPAPLPKQQRQREYPNDLAGTWEFVLWEQGGIRSPRNEDRLMAQMTKDSFALVRKGHGEGERFSMRLEPTRSPPAFTWSINEETVFVGSYRLHNGELTMIFNSGDRVEARPIDFEGKAKHRIVMRRVRR